MTVIDLQNITFSHPAHPIFRDLTLSISDGITGIVGESGCGKSTFFDLLTGVYTPENGKIVYRNEQKKPLRFSVMRQSAALFPWMTALENVNAVLSDRRATRDTAAAFLAAVGLTPAEQNLYPCALSGGMARRVALARTLAADAETYLFDEPFNGLNEELKIETAKTIAREMENRKASALIVTHDAEILPYLTHTVLSFTLTSQGTTAEYENL